MAAKVNTVVSATCWAREKRASSCAINFAKLDIHRYLLRVLSRNSTDLHGLRRLFCMHV